MAASYPYSNDDLLVLAKTVYGEARGEPFLGKLAVAWSVRNRAEADLHHDQKPDWWGEGIAGCALKAWQYSCWNANDPNSAILHALSIADLETNKKFAECYRAAQDALDGVDDPTKGSTHYYATFLDGQGKAPKWADKREPTAVIGAHKFYAGVEK